MQFSKFNLTMVLGITLGLGATTTSASSSEDEIAWWRTELKEGNTIPDARILTYWT